MTLPDGFFGSNCTLTVYFCSLPGTPGDSDLIGLGSELFKHNQHNVKHAGCSSEIPVFEEEMHMRAKERNHS